MELILKTNTKNYFKTVVEGVTVILGSHIFWGEEKTLEQVKEAFKTADIAGYLKPQYNFKDMIKEPLGNLFDIQIYKFGNNLDAKNYNLWEYEIFIKGNKEAPAALKSACICKDNKSNYFYIACEPYDSESALTRENIKTIESYVNSNVKDIEKLLNCNYSHTEIY